MENPIGFKKMGTIQKQRVTYSAPFQKMQADLIGPYKIKEYVHNLISEQTKAVEYAAKEGNQRSGSLNAKNNSSSTFQRS